MTARGGPAESRPRSTHLAFLTANASVWNVVALGSADSALLIRAKLEERTLACDDHDRRYLALVPWRMIPGLHSRDDRT
jgi:hypothetical protein